MSKIITIVCCMVLCSILVWSHPAVAATDTAFNQAMQATVQIAVFDQTGQIISGGSGSLVDAKGLVLTSYHVIADSNATDGWVRVWVPVAAASAQFYEYRGRVIAADLQLDLAVIHLEYYLDSHHELQPIPANVQFPAVRLGNSDQVEFGDAVAVLGYPDTTFGHFAYLEGKIASLINDSGESWIVTDVKAAHGSSGGLLINRAGELIGVPTWVRNDPDTNAALLYSRPIHYALPILAEAYQKVFSIVPPSPTEAGVICQDDFQSNALGWQLGQQSDALVTPDYQIRDGELRMSVVFKEDAFTRLDVPCGFVRNFRLTFDLFLSKADGDGAGIVVAFRQNNAGDGYMVEFSENGSYRLIAMQGNKWTFLQDHPATQSLDLRLGRVNTFVIEAFDSTLTIYANGEKLISLEDHTFTEAGAIALGLIGNKGSKVMGTFDNLVIHNVVTVSSEQAADQLPITATVVFKVVNVRSGAGGGYQVIDHVEQGDILTIVGQRNDCRWLKVEMPTGVTGWVSGLSRYITLNGACSDIQ